MSRAAKKRRFTDEVVTLAHGAGGQSSSALFDAVFGPAFSNEWLDRHDDGAVLDMPMGYRLVISTDSFVVKPRRFPGGSIGHLAVHGTVNDLAVMGAEPRWLTAAFVLEEGLAIDELRGFVTDMAEAASAAGVAIVAGDTKVVERGAADGVYITTTGVGLRPSALQLGADLVRAGDRVVVSGPIGDHGIAILVARGDLHLLGDIRSDTASVYPQAAALLAAAPGTRWLRDPTRGGLASALNELTRECNLGVWLDESSLPVNPIVAGACELLGLDPLYIANEGKLVAVVPAEQAEAAREALGPHAAIVGHVAIDPPGMVVLRTAVGGTRIVDLLVGDPLPRIC